MTAAGPLVVAVALLALVALDLGAYVLAAARAQTAADAVALATIQVADTRGGGTGTPTGEAERIAAANGVRLDACACPPGATEVTVQVSAPVRAIAATRFGPRRVTAVATSRLVPLP